MHPIFVFILFKYIPIAGVRTYRSMHPVVYLLEKQRLSIHGGGLFLAVSCESDFTQGKYALRKDRQSDLFCGAALGHALLSNHSEWPYHHYASMLEELLRAAYMVCQGRSRMDECIMSFVCIIRQAKCPLPDATRPSSSPEQPEPE